MKRILTLILTLACLAAGPATQPRYRPVGFLTISQAINPKATPPQNTQALLKTADDVVTIGKAMDAKAVICWDCSGDDQQDFKYIGDPRLMPKGVNITTMEQFFRRIKSAGIDTGVCLRPGWLVRDAATAKLVYAYSDSYAWCLLAKAAWAKEHYAANWFYCDSTVGPEGFPLDPRPYANLLIQRPDAHWFIENVGVPNDGVWHGYGYADFAVCGHFIDARQYQQIPQDGLKHLIGCVGPEWSPQKKPDGTIDSSRFDGVVVAIKRGDDVMAEIWWGNPMNPTIKAMFDAANAGQ